MIFFISKIYQINDQNVSNECVDIYWEHRKTTEWKHLLWKPSMQEICVSSVEVKRWGKQNFNSPRKKVFIWEYVFSQDYEMSRNWDLRGKLRRGHNIVHSTAWKNGLRGAQITLASIKFVR